MLVTPVSAAATPVSFQDQKFDRQLRLWGSDGQSAIEGAHVILLGVTAVGCEVLKNMILPNLGSFSIVDDANVQQRDLGSNFFLGPDDFGSPIAESALRGLAELNASSTGTAHQADPSKWARNSLLQHNEALGDGTKVVADSWIPKQPGGSLVILCTSRVSQDVVIELSQAVERANCALVSAAVCEESGRIAEANNASFLPLRARCSLVVVEACGLVGVVRLQTGPPSRFVVHTHPDPETTVRDLRPLNPFPALQAWFDAHDPTDDIKYAKEDQWGLHGHIPWTCIVYHALRLHRLELQDPTWMPSASKDYAALRSVITAKLIRRRVPPQESLMQALHECTLALDVNRRLHRHLSQLLQDPRAVHGPQTPHDDLFWFFLHALVVFRQRHDGAMPLSGTMPDMTSTPEWFVELQQIYRNEADANAHEIFEIVHERMQQVLGATTATTSPTTTTRTFASWAACGGKSVEALLQLSREVCRNVWTLTLVSFSSIAAELVGAASLSSDATTNASNAVLASAAPVIVAGGSTDRSFEAWYRVWRGALAFRQRHNGRAPGNHSAVGSGDATVVARTPSLNEEEEDAVVATSSRDEFITNEQRDTDINELLRIVQAQQQINEGDSNHPPPLDDDSLRKAAFEYVRYGGGELNAVASIVGAVAAQECIKLIQQRRVPVADALVFDGNAACGFGTIRLQL